MYCNRKAQEELVPEDGVYRDITTVKDYRGPDRALCSDVEYTIKTFIQDCERIGMPRCQNRCSRDIQKYLKTEKIQSKYFVDDRPGNILLSLGQKVIYSFKIFPQYIINEVRK